MRRRLLTCAFAVGTTGHAGPEPLHADRPPSADLVTDWLDSFVLHAVGGHARPPPSDAGDPAVTERPPHGREHGDEQHKTTGIDFAARTLRISRSVQWVDGKLREFPTKTRRSNRTVPLPGRCIDALAEHHRQLQELHGDGPGRPGHPTGYIFGTPWGTPLELRNLSRMRGQLCDTHGIRRVPLHGLRHPWVCQLNLVILPLGHRLDDRFHRWCRRHPPQIT
jgi:hypothetical protein